MVAGRADGVLRLRVQDDDISIGADRDDALPGVQVENLGAAQRGSQICNFSALERVVSVRRPHLSGCLGDASEIGVS